MAIPGITSLRDSKSLEKADEYFRSIFYRNRYTDNDMYTGDAGTVGITPKAFASHVQNILREASINGKGIHFALNSAALAALNPTLGMGQISNPLSFLGAPPYAGGITTHTLDVGFSSNNPGTTLAREKDRLKRLYEGNYTKYKTRVGIPPVEKIGPSYRNEDGTTIEQKRQELNFASDKGTFENRLPFERQAKVAAPNQVQDDLNGVKVSKPDYEKIFSKVKTGPGFNGFGKGAHHYRPNPDAYTSPTADYLNKKKAMSHDDTFFTKLDAERGFINLDDEIFFDDDAYIPFYFQDFRKPERRIYFRAFIKNLTEKFIPEWKKDKYYGRTESIRVYTGTDRIVNVDFSIVALSNVGLSTMWKKINHFLKMLYPTFTNDGLLYAAPLVRVRIGDLISQNGIGLPAVITDVSLDYNQAPWEIDSYSDVSGIEVGKIPMKCDMSVALEIIHEVNPGVDLNYNYTHGDPHGVGKTKISEEDVLGNLNEDVGEPDDG